MERRIDGKIAKETEIKKVRKRERRRTQNLKVIRANRRYLLRVVLLNST